MLKKSAIIFALAFTCFYAQDAQAQLFRRGVARQAIPAHSFEMNQSIQGSHRSPIVKPFYFSSPQGVARRIPGQTVPVQTFVANFAPARTQSAARRTQPSRSQSAWTQQTTWTQQTWTQPAWSQSNGSQTHNGSNQTWSQPMWNQQTTSQNRGW
ncbi:MAG: hypothetical protein AB8B55_01815 [Mariniblastus sp.]